MPVCLNAVACVFRTGITKLELHVMVHAAPYDRSKLAPSIHVAIVGPPRQLPAAKDSRWPLDRSVYEYKGGKASAIFRTSILVIEAHVNILSISCGIPCASRAILMLDCCGGTFEAFCLIRCSCASLARPFMLMPRGIMPATSSELTHFP